MATTTTMASPTAHWHTLTADAVAEQLTVTPSAGLTGAVAKERLAQHGANELQEKPGTPAWVLFLHQFKSPPI